MNNKRSHILGWKFDEPQIDYVKLGRGEGEGGYFCLKLQGMFAGKLQSFCQKMANFLPEWEGCSFLSLLFLVLMVYSGHWFNAGRHKFFCFQLHATSLSQNCLILNIDFISHMHFCVCWTGDGPLEMSQPANLCQCLVRY